MSDPGVNPISPQEASQRQKVLLLRILRGSFIALLLAVTLIKIFSISPNSPEAEQPVAKYWYVTLFVSLVLGAGVIALDALTPRKKISTIGGILLGLMAGMLATLAVSFIIDLLVSIYGGILPNFANPAKIIVGIALCYIAVSVVLQTQDDFRLVIPYVEFSKQIRGPRPVLLDTSALIDGRFSEIAQTGLVQAPILIPRFVIAELQTLADSSDKLKRARGRRGLDMVGRLQRMSKLDVSIDPRDVPGLGVDAMLVELARQIDGMIVTSDTGLTKVAQIQGVSILNINELAGAVKPSIIPGESMIVRIIRAGEQPGQGVGYLEDGTMVVVEDGSTFIGREVQTMVVSSLQTSAGRLIFTRIGPERPEKPATNGAAHDSSEPVGTQQPVAPSVPAETAAAPETEDEPESPDEPRHSGPFPPGRPARPNRARNPRR